MKAWRLLYKLVRTVLSLVPSHWYKPGKSSLGMRVAAATTQTKQICNSTQASLARHLPGCPFAYQIMDATSLSSHTNCGHEHSV